MVPHWTDAHVGQRPTDTGHQELLAPKVLGPGHNVNSHPWISVGLTDMHTSPTQKRKVPTQDFIIS